MLYPALERTLDQLMKLDPESVLAISDVAEERLRQIGDEGWSPSHDDAHDESQMALAGAAYAMTPHTPKGTRRDAPVWWPWGLEWWKPKSGHRNCVRGAALIVAELARMKRRAPKP